MKPLAAPARRARETHPAPAAARPLPATTTPGRPGNRPNGDLRCGGLPGRGKGAQRAHLQEPPRPGPL